MCIYLCARAYICKCMHVYVYVCASVCTCIGKLRITNKQPRAKLPGIAATKQEALPALAGVLGEGNSESKPPLGGHQLTMGRVRLAIKAGELFFKANGTTE